MMKSSNLALGIARGDTLTDQAEAVLRDSLMSGIFRPGQAITIRALSSLLGVSVTPAKDAMTRLIGERVLEWGPRRSAVVPALTLQSIDEIYTIRLALEAAAAAAAIENINDKAVAELRKIQDKLSAAFARKNYKNVLINNREFHFSIYKRAGLPMLHGLPCRNHWRNRNPKCGSGTPAHCRGSQDRARPARSDRGDGTGNRFELTSPRLSEDLTRRKAIQTWAEILG